ncbi:MAG: PHB depolymerase family esterase [Bacillota bacterium]
MSASKPLGKKVLAWLLLATMVLALAGCGLRSVDNSAANATPSVTQSVSRTPEPGEASPAPSATAEPPEETSWPPEEVDSKGYYTFSHADTVRQYLLYIPDGLEKNTPLVFMLHGYGSTAKQFRELTDMDAVADKYGFAVVYPQGLPGSDAYFSKACWNADLDFTDTDDVGFLTALARYLQKRYSLSSEYTFSAGFSNGGFMGYKLALSAPETFKAVASIAGTMGRGLWAEKDEADTSVSILQIHGTADRTIPIGGSLTQTGGFGGAPPIAEIIEFWRNKYGLNNVQEFDIPSATTAYHYDGDVSDCLVWYYEIEGLEHKWPTEAEAGLDASEVAWEFFSRFIDQCGS